MNFYDEYETPVMVGEGAFGTVYRLKNKNGVDYAALKILTNKAIWEQETYILKNADHQLFPAFIDAGEDEGQYYILMEYIWGERLSDAIVRRGGFAQPEAMRMALTIADGIGWLQTKERPVIFRDLKAENVIISPDGSVRLVDFGSACEAQNANETITGTEGASAPEQLKGETGLYSDVYAFGRLFHFMLTGDNPTKSKGGELKSLSQYYAGLSYSIELLIQDCVSKNPDERIPDMYGVTGRLVEIATSTPSGYKKLEKAAAKSLKERESGNPISYSKNIRK